MQPRTSVGQRGLRAALRIGLINNMPDAALQSTEAQFFGLLKGAAGSQPITVRLSSFPELPRSAEALAQIGSYWPLEELLAEPLDAFIVTGTEPKAARLADEPYWPRFAQLLEYAESHRIASIWSCLAAHAAVETLDGIQRQRLPQKRCGVYAHSTLAGHALLAAGADAPRHAALALERAVRRSAAPGGLYAPELVGTSGADAFVKERGSLLLFFQGHPEYEGTTLLKEYRRDVGRYLNAQQPHYPTLPVGYLSPEATRRPRGHSRPKRWRSAAPSCSSVSVRGGRGGAHEQLGRRGRGALPQLASHVNAARRAARAPEPVSLA